jgi:hypothetical protein
MMSAANIVCSDAVEWARGYSGEPFHALLCDPPYHLSSPASKSGSRPTDELSESKYNAHNRGGFMGKQWDGGDVAFDPATWAAFLSVMYPGAFGMAFASSRGWHKMATAIEDAGFIIHPSLFLWTFGSGFPKATRVNGSTPQELKDIFSGHRYGLQTLKPAAEPIILFAKSEDNWYNSLRDELTIANSLLEELWKELASKKEIASAAHGINTILLKVLGKQDRTCWESGSTAGTAGRSNTNPPEYSEPIRGSGAGTAQESVTKNTAPNLPSEPVKTAGKSSRRPTREKQADIAVEDAPMPPVNSPCYLTPFEMGIDTDTLTGILQSNSERGRLDLSMIWLWKLILVDLCEVASRSTTATGEKMTTELAILNFLLRKLTQDKSAIQSEKSLSGELLYVVQDVVRSFIGLSTYQREQGHIARSVVSPTIVFQRPYEGRPIENITRTGAGVLNIAGGRIEGTVTTNPLVRNVGGYGSNGLANQENPPTDAVSQGRWPSNFYLGDDEAAAALDRQSGITSNGAFPRSTRRGGLVGFGTPEERPQRTELDSGGASRFFFRVQEQLDDADPVRYQAKASRSERDAGLDGMPLVRLNGDGGGVMEINNPDRKAKAGRGESGPPMAHNVHPTVKPLALTKYLATLLLPPVEYAPRRLFVPFAGVASECIGAMQAGWEEVVGVELTEEYIPIAKARVEYWSRKPFQEIMRF